MLNNLPTDKKTGDGLEHEYMNSLAEMYNKIQGLMPDNGIDMLHLGNLLSFSSPGKKGLAVAVVDDLIAVSGDTSDSGLYKIKLRWYMHETGEWVTDDEHEYIMDERGISDPPSYSVGDRLLVVWDEQGSVYVPIKSSGGPFYWGRLSNDMLPYTWNGNTVCIYKFDANQTPTWDGGHCVNDVAPPPWLTEGKIDAGSWVLVTKINSSWFVILAAKPVEIVTDVRVFVDQLKIQKKTRKVLVTPIGNESDWIDIHQGRMC